MNPVEESWVWSYKVTPTDGKKPVSGYDIRRKVTDSGFSDLYTPQPIAQPAGQSTGGPEKPDSAMTTLKFQCRGGAQTNVSAPDFQGVKITRATLQGVSIPAQGNWKAGFGWSYVWTLDGRKGLLSGTGKLGSQASVVGREQITVPAGSFDAWKVEYTFTIEAHLGILPFNKSAKFTQWFAEGTGLVKTQTTDGTIELLSLKK